MVGAVLLALASLLGGGWTGSTHPDDAEPSARAHARDHLTRPDAPGVELMSLPRLTRPDVPRARWVPPPASTLRRPDSPAGELMRIESLGTSEVGYSGLVRPELVQRRLDGLQAPDAEASSSLELPDPDHQDEPLVQRPAVLR